MNDVLRRLRGILGIGGLWGAVGGVVTSLIGVGAKIAVGLPGLAVLDFAMGGAGLGFLLGTSFATLLTLTEGKRTFDQLTVGRAAFVGAVAGAGLTVLWFGSVFLPAVATVVPFRTALLAMSAGAVSYATLSAGLAAATVAIARAAPDELGPGADEPRVRGSANGVGGLLEPGDA